MAKRASSQPALNASFTGEERIVVLHGPQRFLQGELQARLRAALESKTGTEVESTCFDGESATLAGVLDELRSFSLMQQHKFVVVNDADKFLRSQDPDGTPSLNRAALERYAANPVDTATLLLRTEKWNAGKIDKLIESVGVILKCEDSSRREIEPWLLQRCASEHKVKLDRGALSLLIDHIGLDLGLLDSELGKLAVSVEPGGTITPQQVEVLVGFASDEKAWAIQGALLDGDRRRSLEMIRELLELSQQDAVPIAWSISDLMRKLHHAAVLSEGGMNGFAIAGKLKIWPAERAEPLLRVARRLGPAGAARLLDEALTLDRRSKSGFGDPARNLEIFCVRYAEATG